MNDLFECYDADSNGVLSKTEAKLFAEDSLRIHEQRRCAPRKNLNLTDQRVHCVDDRIAIKYDNTGLIFIGGAEPNGVVHTSRYDCRNYT